MFPFSVCKRTVPVTVKAAVILIFPVVTHDSKSEPPEIPDTAGVKQPDAVTVPIV